MECSCCAAQLVFVFIGQLLGGKKRGVRGIGRVVWERKGCKERVERDEGGPEESVKLRPSRDFL